MKSTMKQFLLVGALSFLSTSAFSQESPKDDPWEKFGFGVGLSYTIDTGHHDRVKSAEVVNGVVRVTDEENGVPRIVLEGHYFFGAKDGFGHGPFIAVQPGENEVINSVALGYMIGLRKVANTTSWNLGLGIAADPNVQVLGGGIKENKPLPAGEESVRYKEETQYGIMILFSTTW